jgi:hypothetical protein
MILGDLRRNASTSTGSQGSAAAAGNIFLSRHIPIDDVSDRLDALAEAECVRSRPASPLMSPHLAISV